jgi:nitrate/nitrite-specific signal transduction histidine kinase
MPTFSFSDVDYVKTQTNKCFFIFVFIMTLLPSVHAQAQKLRAISAVGTYQFSQEDKAQAREQAIAQAKANALQKYARTLSKPQRKTMSKHMHRFVAELDLLVPETEVKAERLANYSNSINVAIIAKVNGEAVNGLIASLETQ